MSDTARLAADDEQAVKLANAALRRASLNHASGELTADEFRLRRQVHLQTFFGEMADEVANVDSLDDTVQQYRVVATEEVVESRQLTAAERRARRKELPDVGTLDFSDLFKPY